MKVTRHYVQPYRTPKRSQRLVAADTLQAQSAAAARERARRMYATGRYAGVEAVTVTIDPDVDEYGEPEFLLRLGRTPHREEP